MRQLAEQEREARTPGNIMPAVVERLVVSRKSLGRVRFPRVRKTIEARRSWQRDRSVESRTKKLSSKTGSSCWF
jgi:hypothetical protein